MWYHFSTNCFQEIIDRLGPAILPYSILLVVPVLGRMSDQNHQVRLVATRCFATLMQYIPIEVSIVFAFMNLCLFYSNN